MRILILMLKFGLASIMFAVISAGLGYMYFASNLPELTSLSEYQPPLVSRVYNTEGELLAEYADEHRILTPMRDIPKQVIDAFLAAEDEHFYQHPGINPPRIMAAAIANFKAGRTVQGGSTITQQVAKNFLLTSERTYTRKIREIMLAYQIESAFTKDDILYLYLNHIYLGRGSYGVASAAWRYFGKRLDELTLAESAMLAGLPKAPGKYAPHLNLQRATKRRDTVLKQIARSGFAKVEDVNLAMREPLLITPLAPNKLLNAYGNEVHRQLIRRFGVQTLRKQGLTIIVPYQPEIEKQAIHAVRKGILDVEQRQFYRFPTHHQAETWQALLDTWGAVLLGHEEPLADDQLRPALIEEVMSNGDLSVNDGKFQWLLSKPKWKWEDYPDINLPDNSEEPIITTQRPRTWMAGDEIVLQGAQNGGVRLTQMPSIESALYSIDLKRGTVLARVGGFDFKFGDFDRVSQAKRQPGSAFKPLLYATAMEQGFTPASIVMDTPIVFGSQTADQFWRPENYKNKFAGPVTLRDALEHSRNLSAIKVLQDVGINTFLDKLRDFPFEQEFPRQLALALGATEAPLEQMTEAYIIIAGSGQKWKPVSVQQVQDRNGKTLHRAISGNRCQVCHVDPVLSVGDGMRPAQQVLDPTSAFLTTNMMKGVIERGTGRRARALNRPAAGKTGTTNKQVDAWFMGYTPQILTGVWTGRDIPTPMGRRETGSRAALPTWLNAMKAMHQGKKKEDFIAPNNIEWALIDRKTGLLADAATQSPLLEAFRRGSAPTEVSTDANNPDHPDTAETDFLDSDL